MRYFIFSIGFFLLLSQISICQSSPEEITKTFFKKYESEGHGKAIDYIFSTNPWMTNQQENTLQIKTRLDKAISMIGNYYGYELVIEKTIGDSYKMFSYMLKYSRQPIQFTFILYKPNDKWQIQNLKFDDQLLDDLEEQDNLVKHQ